MEKERERESKKTHFVTFKYFQYTKSPNIRLGGSNGWKLGHRPQNSTIGWWEKWFWFIFQPEKLIDLGWVWTWVVYSFARERPQTRCLGPSFLPNIAFNLFFEKSLKIVWIEMTASILWTTSTAHRPTEFP